MGAQSAPLATVDYICERTGFTKPRVYELIRQDRIGGVAKFGRNVVVNRELFDKWLTEQFRQ